MDNRITICYVDDDATLALDKYLNKYCSKKNIKYQFVDIKSSERFADIVDKLVYIRGSIMVLDSKLYKDDDSGDKITGEELEMVLTNRCKYLSTILISQNDNNNKLNCIKKYSTAKDGKSYENQELYYESVLGPLLDNECSKFDRFYSNMLDELDKKQFIDKCEIENIKSELDNGAPELPLTKEDIDKAVNLLNKLFDKIDK